MANYQEGYELIFFDFVAFFLCECALALWDIDFFSRMLVKFVITPLSICDGDLISFSRNPRLIITFHNHKESR